MSDLPPPWRSFYDRALEYLEEPDLEEAKWSAERALHYLENTGEHGMKRLVTALLQRIATLQGKPTAAPKSLWQHLRED